MKKNLMLFIGALLALSLASCGTEPAVDGTAAQTTEVVTVFTEEVTTAFEAEETTVAEETTEETASETEHTEKTTPSYVQTEKRPSHVTEETTEDEPSDIEPFSYENSDLSGYIMLGKYLGIKVHFESLPPLEMASIDTELELFMESVAFDAAIREGECRYGDKINIDYYGTIDGEEFNGSSGEGFMLTLGNHEYIFDVDDALVGMMVGETREITATFPKDYGNSNYNGKTVDFAITLNYIYPKLTDELVSLYTDCATVAEFKKQIENSVFAEYKDLLRDAAMDKAMANSYFITLPREEVNAVYDSIVGANKALAITLHKTYREYLNDTYGITEAEAEEIFMNSARNEVAQRVLVYAIARDMGMDVSRKACEGAILEAVGYESMEKFISDMDIDEAQLDNLCYNAIREKVVGEILSQADFVK